MLNQAFVRAVTVLSFIISFWFKLNLQFNLFLCLSYVNLIKGYIMSFQYLKINQIAKMFCVSRDTIVKWIIEGTLPAITTPGGHYRVLADEVDKLQEKIKYNPNK